MTEHKDYNRHLEYVRMSYIKQSAESIYPHNNSLRQTFALIARAIPSTYLAGIDRCCGCVRSSAIRPVTFHNPIRYPAHFIVNVQQRHSERTYHKQEKQRDHD